MADTFSKTKRSQIMAAVKSKDTTPEMAVRRLLHGMGFRYRLHVSTLPGKPDIVLPRLRKIIEVRGCFWHSHSCGNCRLPTTRHAWWKAKLARNAQRDQTTIRVLRKLGWRVLVVWECQTPHPGRLARRLRSFLT